MNWLAMWATYVTWKLRLGPRCGDQFCYRPEHWPRGRVKHP